MSTISPVWESDTENPERLNFWIDGCPGIRGVFYAGEVSVFNRVTSVDARNSRPRSDEERDPREFVSATHLVVDHKWTSLQWQQ